MFRCGRGAIAFVVVAVAWSSAAPASAEIARPPGANPSNRGYELVSLPDTRGAAMYAGVARGFAKSQPPSQLSRAGGSALIASSLPIPGQRETGGLSAFRADRQASGQWTHTFVGMPQRRAEYDGFASIMQWTPDFTTMLWQPSDKAPDPADPTPVEYFGTWISLMRQPVGGTPREQFNTGSYFSSQPANNETTVTSALSSDGRTVTFRNRTSSFADGTPPGSVYQRTDDGPVKLVSVDPNGAPLTNADLIRASTDGSRVLLSSDDGSGSLARLYLRDGNTTVAIDAARQNLATPRTNSGYAGATADLATTFFVSRDRLLPADTDDDADVYRWSNGDLTLISRGSGTGGNGSGADCAISLPSTQVSGSVQGCDAAYVASSPDGDVTYFLSPERLDGAAGAEPGGANLYARRGTGEIRYVLTLDPSDGVAVDRFNPYATNRDFSAEEDGSLLVRTLRNPSGGSFDTTQIVRVDPQTAQTACISCTADGGSASEAQLASFFSTEGAGIPTGNATSDGRHVFFDTPARLVPEDRNTGVDVYDYDVASGTRSLVSSAGSGIRGSYFEGVSGDGTDVLIATTDSLVAEDQNGRSFKVYDARRGGGQEKPSTAPVVSCGDDACKPPASPTPQRGNPTSAQSGSSRGNVPKPRAVRVVLGGVSAAQRRTLARGGRVSVRVRTSAAATVRVRARAKVGRRTLTVASGSVRLRRAGSGRVTLRLTAAARRELRARGTLRISITGSVSGGRNSKKVSFSLRATTNAKAGAR